MYRPGLPSCRKRGKERGEAVDNTKKRHNIKLKENKRRITHPLAGKTYDKTRGIEGGVLKEKPFHFKEKRLQKTQGSLPP